MTRFPRNGMIQIRFDSDPWDSCSWVEWLEANEGMVETGEARDVERALLRNAVYRGGGGAAPFFEIRRYGVPPTLAQIGGAS